MADEITIEQIQAVVDSVLSKYTQPIEQKLEAISAVVSSMYSSLDRITGDVGMVNDNLTIMQGGVDKLEAYFIGNNDVIQGISISISGVAESITAIEINNEPVLNAIESIKTDMTSAIESSKIEVMNKNIEINLDSITQEISSISGNIIDTINSIVIPEQVDISGVESKIDNLSEAIREIPNIVISGIPEYNNDNIYSLITSSTVDIINAIDVAESAILDKNMVVDLSEISNEITVASNDIKVAIGAIQIPPPADISLLQGAIAEVNGNVLAIPDRVVVAIPKQEVNNVPIVFDDTKILNAIGESMVVYGGTNQLIINSTASVLDAVSTVEDGVKELNNTIANSEGIEVDEFTEF